MFSQIINFILDVTITGAFLWVGMKVTAKRMGMVKGSVYCSYWELLIAVVASSLVGLVPSIGWVLSIITLFWLMMKFTEAGFIEVLWMVAIAKVAFAFALLVILPLLI